MRFSGFRRRSMPMQAEWNEAVGSRPIATRDITMSIVTIEEAQAKLPELIDKLAPGEEVIITRNE